ncbi:MAG: acyl dehydratase [Rhodocyclaceae bacterium]|jgi:3-hydroxybutyryl-CoA dehydratase|nr:acyl dehydratase [Rhodocyclaceae bacterium]
MHPGRGFNEVSVGDCFSSVMTLTETHIVMGAGLFGDFNPLHVNEEFAGESRFGRRIAHGYLTSSMMAAALGMLFHGTAIAYLEHACRFTAPVHAGDTLTTTWTITGLEQKPHHGGGVAALSGMCRDQDGDIVAEASAKMLIRSV